MTTPRFNPPPNWPPLPARNWEPRPGWRIPSDWKVPQDWPLWVDAAGRPASPPLVEAVAATRTEARPRRTAVWTAGGVVAGLVIGSIVAGSGGSGTAAPLAALPAVTATATANATATATATATVTAKAKPGPTKTVRVRTTVTARPKPRPRVTETVYRDELSSGGSEDEDVYYSNCSEARAAGADPVRRGDPGYGGHLDADDDGVGCE